VHNKKAAENTPKNFEKQKRKQHLKESDHTNQKIWESIAKNYDMIQGAQLSNSFITLMALSEANEPLNTTQISEIISLHTKGQIYKISATLKDSLEHRLKREGYVESIDVPTQQGSRNPVKMSLYSITPKGRNLLKGWISFLSPYSQKQ
jgi:DNA-binding PadR family transcriptional regulator